MSFAAMIALSAACQTSRPISAADQAAIRAADSPYHAAVNAGNAEAVTTFFASDATVMPGNMPPAHGSEAIRQFWRGLFGMMSATVAIKSERVVGQGNIAHHIGSYHFAGTLRDSSHTQLPPEDGKYLQVFVKQDDGSWKLLADAWSANAPPPAPPAAPAQARRKQD